MASRSHPAELRRALAEALAQRDTQGVMTACEGLLALNRYDQAALRFLGALRLETGDPASAAGLFARLDRLSLGKGFVTALCYDAVMDAERAERGEAYVHTLDDVLLDTGYWVVLDRDRAYSRETHGRAFANSPLVHGRATPDSSAFIVSFPVPTVTIDTPCILLGGDDNYSHWLARSVLKLALLETDAVRSELPLLVNDDLRPYQREYLRLLGIPETRLLKVPRGAVIRCRRLVVPTMLCAHPQMRFGLDWIRQRLGNLLAAETEAVELLYVSRRDAPKRRLLNEPELEKRLADLGFRVFVAGEVSVREQIAAFSRARLIVAPHGAALTNLIFSPRNALVIEIASSNIMSMVEFRAIAAHLGQRIVTVVSERYADEQPPGVSTMHLDYTVDVARLVDLVIREAPWILHRPASDAAASAR